MFILNYINLKYIIIIIICFIFYYININLLLIKLYYLMYNMI